LIDWEELFPPSQVY